MSLIRQHVLISHFSEKCDNEIVMRQIRTTFFSRSYNTQDNITQIKIECVASINVDLYNRKILICPICSR